jgi:N-acetylneuraminate synthase
MSSFQELDDTVSFLRSQNASFSILQCTTSYPTKPKQYGLNVILELKERYNVPVGFSDHSASIATGIAAVALGAEILEFHVVFDKEMFGPDVASSLTFPKVTELIESVNAIEAAVQNPVDKTDNSQFTNLKSIFEKSLAVNKSLAKGHVLTFQDLEAKKPKGFGIDAALYQDLIGKKLSKDHSKWDFINHESLKDYE